MRHDSEVTPSGIPAQSRATRQSASARKTVTGQSRPAQVTAVARHGMIATAAYYCAERRGFAAGGDLEDWLVAETEIDRQFGGG
jgi:hypothetical protein